MDDLLRAGQLVFAERGIAGATIDEVTASAGVAKGTFYLYFQSKTDLVTALRQRFADELLSAMAAHADAGPDGDWLGLARWQLESAVDAYLDNAPLHHVLFQDAPAAHEMGAPEGAWATKITRGLTEMIQHGVAAGAFDVGDPELTAGLLFHAVHGLIHHALHKPGSIDRTRVLDAAWELIARTLTGHAVKLDRSDRTPTGRQRRGPPADGGNRRAGRVLAKRSG